MAGLLIEVLYAIAWLIELNVFLVCSANAVLLVMMKLSIIKVKDLKPAPRKTLTSEQFRVLMIVSVMVAFIAYTGVVSSSIHRWGTQLGHRWGTQSGDKTSGCQVVVQCVQQFRCFER